MKRYEYYIFLDRGLSLKGYMLLKCDNENEDSLNFKNFREIVNRSKLRKLKSLFSINKVTYRVFIQNDYENFCTRGIYNEIIDFVKQNQNRAIFACLDRERRNEVRKTISYEIIDNILISDDKTDDDISVVFGTLAHLKRLDNEKRIR